MAVRLDLAGFEVHLVDHNPIRSQIGHEQESVGRIGADPMRMRPFLPLLVGTRTRVSHELGSRQDAAIGASGKTATVPVPYWAVNRQRPDTIDGQVARAAIADRFGCSATSAIACRPKFQMRRRPVCRRPSLQAA